MNLDTAYLGLTMASTNIFPSDVDCTDSPTLPSPEPPQAVSAFVPEVSKRGTCHIF